MKRLLAAACVLLVGACSTGPRDTEFKDCADCPVMVTVPPGSFLMGTAVADRRIDPSSGRPNKNEEPQHEVTISQPFAIGKYEITVAEFAAFVDATGYDADVGCIRLTGPGRLRTDPALNWRNPGFELAANDPVVCVSLDHALAYTAWLSEQTGFSYAIPSEAQWEYAAKAGTAGRYFWGDDLSQACDYANVNFSEDPPPCDDGYPGIAPVGQFKPNAFGLHDTVSNVWEWTTDCAHKNYVDAPTDGSAWIDEPDCLLRMIRSGGVRNVLARTTHVVRAGRPKTGTAPNLGFRVVRLADGAQLVALTTQAAPAGEWPQDVPGAEAFAVNCELCHTEQSSIKGIYGTDFGSLHSLIRDGGNNIMSMPAFKDRISAAEIEQITVYLMQQKGWD
jgi:formylglycine-generating enzyme required for sulfatase activity